MNKRKTVFILIGIALIVVAIVLVIHFFGKEKEKTMIVGMVSTGSIDEPGWNSHHYEGLKAASEDMNVKLIVKQNVAEFSGDCKKAVQELIDEKAELIILSSFNYRQEVADLIEKNPKVNFYCCASGEQDDNSTIYFIRDYQARYLAGIVAGMQTKNNKIGYVAAMKNTEVNRGINAFALGVQSVNPDANVYVVWTGSWNNENEEKKLAEELIKDVGVDLITYHQNQPFVIDVAEKAGIMSIGHHEFFDGYSERYLTAAIESWESVYAEILKEHAKGKINRGHLCWIGIEKGAVGLAPFTSLVDDETKKCVEAAKIRIQNGWEVFSDDIETIDGAMKCQKGEVISDDILFGKMDWLVKGVIEYEK